MSNHKKVMAIINSRTNGQIEQMARQIDEYGELYSVFDEIYCLLRDICPDSAGDMLAGIVIAYHHVKYR